MKYMLIMRSTEEAMEQFADADFTEITNRVGQFNDELVRAEFCLPPRASTPTHRRA